MSDRILSTLGLARRAGKLKSGELAVELCIKKQQAALVIIAEDASINTKKKLKDKCAYRNISCVFYSDKEKLGKAVGTEERAAVALTDNGFAESILKQLTEG